MSARSPFDRLAAVLDSDLPKCECWVLLVFARYDLPKGCYPSIERVMRETRLSNSAVRKAIQSLKKRGLLTTTGYSHVGTKRYKVKLPPRGGPRRHGVAPAATPKQDDRHGVAPKRPSLGGPKKGGEGDREEGDFPPNPPEGGSDDLASWLDGCDPNTPPSEWDLERTWRYIKANAPAHLQPRRRADVAAAVRTLVARDSG